MARNKTLRPYPIAPVTRMEPYMSVRLYEIWASIIRCPRPSVAPMNISATIITTSAIDIPVRTPTNVWDNVSKNITSKKIRRGDEPIDLAANIRVRRAFITPYATLKTTMSQPANAATAIFEKSPKPKSKRNSGNIAVAGVDLKKSMMNC